MPLLSFLGVRRERRARLDRDASDLLTFLGDLAYSEARERARSCRGKSDRAGDRHWSRVAVEIARRTQYEIGETAADRYERTARAERAISPCRREIADGLAEIAAGIADLARGRGNAMTLHNINAAVLRPSAQSGPPKARDAARTLCRACEDLAAAPVENASAISQGIYPVSAETAGHALQRFRAALQG